MDPPTRGTAGSGPWLPRTRGDGPRHVVAVEHVQRAPPHTRGWTRVVDRSVDRLAGSPAHAGMDRPVRCRPSDPAWLPRTRGDGPQQRVYAAVQLEAPPHTRGWTRAGVGNAEDRIGSPAHAGMDPVPLATPRPPRWLPRTRGDGPGTGDLPEPDAAAPPHTRGWTHGGAAGRQHAQGSPAHAGMDPMSSLSFVIVSSHTSAAASQPAAGTFVTQPAWVPR